MPFVTLFQDHLAEGTPVELFDPWGPVVTRILLEAQSFGKNTIPAMGKDSKKRGPSSSWVIPSP